MEAMATSVAGTAAARRHKRSTYQTLLTPRASMLAKRGGGMAAIVALSLSPERRNGRLPSRLITHRGRPRAELQPVHELQIDMMR